MTRTLMQPKIYNLRLNLEQVGFVAEGLTDNRSKVADESLPLYDSMVEDLFDQFRSQGLAIESAPQNEEPETLLEEEITQALEMFQALKDDLIGSDEIDAGFRRALLFRIDALRTLLFGADEVH